jgi:hypothetical protein
MENYSLVENLPDREEPIDYGYTCDSWLEVWEIVTGFKATKCCCISCDKPAVMVSHVKSCVAWKDPARYLIPLCEEHGSLDYKEQFWIKGYLIAIKKW